MLRRLAVPGAILGAALLVYWPILFGASYCLRDFLVWTLPSRALIREALLEGQLALWHPHLGLGMPAGADPVNGLFYPPHLLLALFPLVTGVNVLCLLHILVGAWGAFVLSRAVGARPVAAVAGAITFMLCGITTSGWASGLGVITSAWMPWCAAAAVHLGRSAGGAGIAAAAAALAPTALAGDPFQFIRAGLLALPLALGAARAAGLPIWRAGLRMALAGGLGALLAAAAIAPALASLDASERQGGLPQKEAERWSLHPVRLVEMASPGALGNATDAASYTGARWLADDRLGPVPWCLSVYMGIGLVGLAPLALRRKLGGVKTLAGPLAIAASLGLILALGRHTPAFAATRAIVPALGYFRYPEKFLDVFAVAAAALIALGAEAALRAPGQAARRMVLTAAGLWLGAGLAHLLGAPPTMPRALGIAGFLAVALALALAWVERLGSRGVGSALLVLVLGADLAMAATPLLHWIPSRAITDVPLPLQPARGAPPPRIYRDPSTDNWAPTDARTQALFYARTLRGNLAALHGLGVVPGYQSAHTARWHTVWDQASQDGGRALRLFGVQHMFGSEIWDRDLDAPNADQPLVYSVREPLPRAYLAGRAVMVEASDGRPWGLASRVAAMADGQTAAVEDAAARVDLPNGRVGECSITRYQRERVDVECRADREAMLVLVEAWAPGWEATVDGAAARVFRVNGIARGVRLSSGRHRVEFRYRPSEVAWGIALSALGLVAVGTLAVIGRRRRGAPPPAGGSSPLPDATSPA